MTTLEFIKLGLLMGLCGMCANFGWNAGQATVNFIEKKLKQLTKHQG